MLRQIAHRGPDSEDTYIDKNISLGFRRLSIIDLAGGSQPMRNEDQTKILVFNGEIYNYQSLREELIARGHAFSTQSDSEVLIHGYEEYGKGLLLKLRGMFSFIIWDSRAQKLFGARDFFGIKPFYYARMKETVLFGSEIKGFLAHPRFKKELFEEKLPDYLTFSCVPGNETFFKNVYKLPPGYYLEYCNGKLAIDCYFKPELRPEHDKSMGYFVDQIEKSARDSVLAHKISDVEVGSFLSSGVDSSYITRELARVNPVRTYTIGFDNPLYNEAADVAPFAREIGVENYVKTISAKEYFSTAGKVQYHLDEPLANPSANLLYFLSQFAARDVKVALSGEGADEMFGGYNIYQEPLALKHYQKIPLILRRAFVKIIARLPDFTGKNFIIRGSKSVEERYIGNSNIFSVQEREALLQKTYPRVLPQHYTKSWYDDAKNLDDISKMQYLDINVWMVQEILQKADKMSMAHSLELRVPFLDIEVFKLARRLPQEYKVSSKNTKLSLRAAAARNINKTSAERKKLAFPLPLVEWLRQDEYCALLKQYFTNAAARAYFHTETLLELLNEHKNANKNNARKLWTVFTFLIWHEQFFQNN